MAEDLVRGALIRVYSEAVPAFASHGFVSYPNPKHGRAFFTAKEIWEALPKGWRRIWSVATVEDRLLWVWSEQGGVIDWVECKPTGTIPLGSWICYVKNPDGSISWGMKKHSALMCRTIKS